MDEPLVNSLDFRAVGSALVALVGVSAQLGHKSPKFTASDYGADLSLESAFVRDMMTKSTKEITERWFGDPLYAQRLVSAAVAKLVNAHRRPRPDDDDDMDDA